MTPFSFNKTFTFDPPPNGTTISVQPTPLPEKQCWPVFFAVNTSVWVQCPFQPSLQCLWQCVNSPLFLHKKKTLKRIMVHLPNKSPIIFVLNEAAERARRFIFGAMVFSVGNLHVLHSKVSQAIENLFRLKGQQHLFNLSKAKEPNATRQPLIIVWGVIDIWIRQQTINFNDSLVQYFKLLRIAVPRNGFLSSRSHHKPVRMKWQF